MAQFESVLKGHGFSRAVSIIFSLRLQPLRDGKLHHCLPGRLWARFEGRLVYYFIGRLAKSFPDSRKRFTLSIWFDKL